MTEFSYILRKIEAAPFRETPFRHLYIENLFEPEHFSELLRSDEIDIGAARDDALLIEKLHQKGFKEIKFPGSTTDVGSYLAWRRNRDDKKHDNAETCEGFGITFRLETISEGTLLHRADSFFKSQEFLSVIARKCGVQLDETSPDNGLQKYLDGYEISPHPDIRAKALTYMINVNPAPQSEALEIHTHYLKFKPEWEYVRQYWEGHPEHDRCWVPWDWCETVAQQKPNNSMVLFSPDNDTLHAIRTRYDHLPFQRTQFYGNLWYKSRPLEGKPNWRDFVVRPTRERKADDPWYVKLTSGLPTLEEVRSRFGPM